MKRFLQRHQDNILGVLSGFDRVRFRGTLRWLIYPAGMTSFLSKAGVLLKDFKDYVQGVTKQVRQTSVDVAEQAQRPVQYLQSPKWRKEDIARDIAERDGITNGLICVLRCVEPCMSYNVGPNRQTKMLELRYEPRQCLHHYHYYQHPTLGFMHVRLQTWFPFTIQVCINGREWLARQMDASGIGYLKRENCFLEIDDIDAAQQLFDRQQKINYASLLTGLAKPIDPAWQDLSGLIHEQRYWSIEQSEWATDVMFRSPEALADLYPRLVRHGIETFSCTDVLRFLGQKVPAHGGVHGRFAGEIVSDLTRRPEGIRLLHRLGPNLLKMYDKFGWLLRIEAMFSEVLGMKAFRSKEGDPKGKKAWLPLRKGVADVHRRCKLSQAANARYLDALSVVESDKPLGELLAGVCRPVIWKGHRYRAWNPHSADDVALFEAVSRGEFSLNGFRNRDLRRLLFGEKKACQEEIRRQSGVATRKLRLLRAHGLIRKVPKTHRYQLTDKGREILTSILTARAASTKELARMAA